VSWRLSPPSGWTIAFGAASLAFLVLLVGPGGYAGFRVLEAGLIAVCFLALLYVGWHAEPAATIAAAILLYTFSGNWQAFGLPRFVAPDRLLLLAGVVTVFLRAPGARKRPSLELRPLHGVLAVTVLYAVGSSISAGTIQNSDSHYALVDRFVVPLLIFTIVPLAFYLPRHRHMLMVAFVAFGAYLGLTSLLETVGPRALVFPQFILDPAIGIHADRARGPFLEANFNGIALFACAVTAVMAFREWRSLVARLAAAAVIVLCSAGLLFTLTRAVWVAAIVAPLLTLLLIRDLRRFLVPTVIGGAALVAVLLAVIPGLPTRVTQRAGYQRPVWERQNVDRAAMAMIGARPLFGFGWGRFTDANGNYFSLLNDVPQVVEPGVEIHNVYLALGTELGIAGALLYFGALALAVRTALRMRGPPDLRPWQIALIPITIFWCVMALFSPLAGAWPNYIVWLWSGVVIGGGRVMGARLRL
jgi:putative inorganic carbon (hco3(-)) transporter